MSPLLTEIFKVWFIISFSLGCWTCLNLAVSRRGDYSVKKIIMAFILVLLVPPLNGYMALTVSKPVQLLLAVAHQLTWAYGPLMVLLVKQILIKKTSRAAITWHTLPFLLALAYGLSGRHWISFPTFMSILFIQVFAYLGYAIYLLLGNRQRLLNLSTQHKNTTYYWLLYLIGGLTLIMLADVGFYLNVYIGHLHLDVFSAVIGSVVAIYVCIIAIFAVYQPAVFFHEKLQQDVCEDSSQETDIGTFSPPQLRSVELSPEAAQDLDRQLQSLVDLHKPHMDESISLPKLASLLGVTTHQLSELLNVHKSTNFHDFMNELRYQEALLFLSQIDAELTIADIAYQSGFNNRNTFYKVFRQKTGLTPSEYKKSSTGINIIRREVKVS